jgi:hypothetical protein
MNLFAKMLFFIQIKYYNKLCGLHVLVFILTTFLLMEFMAWFTSQVCNARIFVDITR